MRRAADQQKRNPQDKFKPPKDPFEIEGEIDVIQPLGQKAVERMLGIANDMIASGRLSPGEINAIEVYKVQLLTEGFPDAVKHEFQRDFSRWLLGRGREEDHKRTPWYRAPLTDDDEVSLYIDRFVAKRQDFLIKLKLLSMRRPVGIKQTYLYWKYLVRGTEANDSSFLDDWKLLENDFMTARGAGQDWKDPEKGSHEIAPYGAVRGQMAREFYEEDDRRKSTYTSAWVPQNRGDNNDQGARPPNVPPGPPPGPQGPQGGPQGPRQGGGGGAPPSRPDGDDNDDSDSDGMDTQADNPYYGEALSHGEFAQMIGQSIANHLDEQLLRRLTPAQASDADREHRERLEGRLVAIQKDLDAAKTAKQPTQSLEDAMKALTTEMTRSREFQQRIYDAHMKQMETMNKSIASALEASKKAAALPAIDQSRPQIEEVIQSEVKKAQDIANARVAGLIEDAKNNRQVDKEEIDSLRKKTLELEDALSKTKGTLATWEAQSELKETQARLKALELYKSMGGDTSAVIKATIDSNSQQNRELVKRSLTIVKGHLDKLLDGGGKGELEKVMRDVSSELQKIAGSLSPEQAVSMMTTLHSTLQSVLHRDALFRQEKIRAEMEAKYAQEQRLREEAQKRIQTELEENKRLQGLQLTVAQSAIQAAQAEDKAKLLEALKVLIGQNNQAHRLELDALQRQLDEANKQAQLMRRQTQQQTQELQLQSRQAVEESEARVREAEKQSANALAVLQNQSQQLDLQRQRFEKFFQRIREWETHMKRLKQLQLDQRMAQEAREDAGPIIEEIEGINRVREILAVEAQELQQIGGGMPNVDLPQLLNSSVMLLPHYISAAEKAAMTAFDSRQMVVVQEQIRIRDPENTRKRVEREEPEEPDNAMETEESDPSLESAAKRENPSYDTFEREDIQKERHVLEDEWIQATGAEEIHLANSNEEIMETAKKHGQHAIEIARKLIALKARILEIVAREEAQAKRPALPPKEKEEALESYTSSSESSSSSSSSSAIVEVPKKKNPTQDTSQSYGQLLKLAKKK